MVAPLMSPLLSLSMASVMGLSHLFRRSLTAIIEGAGLAILLSAVIRLLFISAALRSLGAIAHRGFGTYQPKPNRPWYCPGRWCCRSLCPRAPAPDCRSAGRSHCHRANAALYALVGIGIAFNNTAIILGALLLFVTNMIAISFAGILTFAAMGFGARNMEENNALSQSLSISATLVIVIGLLLAGLAWNTISEARLYNQASTVIVESVNEYATADLVDLNITSVADVKNITVTLRTTRNLSYPEVFALQSEIAKKLNSPIALELITIPMQILAPQDTPTPSAEE